jgi:hypothetical protein
MGGLGALAVGSVDRQHFVPRRRAPRCGLSIDLHPDAKVFLDYDGKFSSRLQ